MIAASMLRIMRSSSERSRERVPCTGTLDWRLPTTGDELPHLARVGDDGLDVVGEDVTLLDELVGGVANAAQVLVFRCVPLLDGQPRIAGCGPFRLRGGERDRGAGERYQ